MLSACMRSSLQALSDVLSPALRQGHNSEVSLIARVDSLRIYVNKLASTAGAFALC